MPPASSSFRLLVAGIPWLVAAWFLSLPLWSLPPPLPCVSSPFASLSLSRTFGMKTNSDTLGKARLKIFNSISFQRFLSANHLHLELPNIKAENDPFGGIIFSLPWAGWGVVGESYLPWMEDMGLLSILCEPDAVLSTLCVSFFIPGNNLVWNRYPHFTDEEIGNRELKNASKWQTL